MKKIIPFLLLFYFSNSIAQQALVTSGGNALGTTGSSSYTIGQVAYTNQTGTNGKVTQGVQQPFEIVTLGTNDFPEITVVMTVYPNPTTNSVSLKIQGYAGENRNYQLFAINGKMIQSQNISQEETQISLENLASAIYLLQVSDNNKVLKTFKIIKT